MRPEPTLEWVFDAECGPWAYLLSDVGRSEVSVRSFSPTNLDSFGLADLNSFISLSTCSYLFIDSTGAGEPAEVMVLWIWSRAPKRI